MNNKQQIKEAIAIVKRLASKACDHRSGWNASNADWNISLLQERAYRWIEKNKKKGGKQK